MLIKIKLFGYEIKGIDHPYQRRSQSHFQVPAILK